MDRRRSQVVGEAKALRACREYENKDWVMHFSVGDIVVRSDIKGRKRYVILRIDPSSGWIYARPVTGGGGTVTFPSQFMLKKVS